MKEKKRAGLEKQGWRVGSVNGLLFVIGGLSSSAIRPTTSMYIP